MGPLRSSTGDQHDYDLCASDSTCINDNFTPVLGSLLYLYLHFQDVKIAALLDSGTKLCEICIERIITVRLLQCLVQQG